MRPPVDTDRRKLLQILDDNEEFFVQKMADAILRKRVSQAISLLNGFSFPIEHDLEALFKRICRESEASQAIVAVSFIESRIIDIFEFHMRALSNRERERTFGPNGPLSTFSSRIVMAYALGWLSQRSLSNLDHLRRVRNLFAHEAHRVTFDDSRILRELDKINVDVEGHVHRVRQILIGFGQERIKDTRSLQEESIIKIILVIDESLSELMLFPIAHQHGIAPTDMLDEAGSPPKPIQDLHRGVARATYAALRHQQGYR